MEWRSFVDDPPEQLDGALILAWREGWDIPQVLIWKENRRIVESHRKGYDAELAERYFGDFVESDDYALAHADGRPTHWIWLGVHHFEPK